MTARLAVETSSSSCSLSWHDEEGVTDVIPNHVRSSEMVAAFEQFIRQSKKSLGDVSTVLVSQGPGNYTGLRLGLAFVQGLALSRPLTIRAFHSLDVLFESWRAEQPEFRGSLSCFVDARGQSVLTRTCQMNEGEFEEVSPTQLLSPQEALSLVGPGRAVFGSAVRLYADLVEDAGVSIMDDVSLTSRALITLDDRGLGQEVAVENLQPIYARSPV